MNKYEIVMIMSTKITTEERKSVIDKVKKYITQSGKIEKIEDIGEKELAYEIKKHKNGYYYSIYFNTEPQNIAELERISRITEEILKFIIVKIDELKGW